MVLASLKSESSTIPIPRESPEAGALQRGLLLLELMVNAGRALTLTELSELSNLHASTVHRLMQTLTQSEHVFRDGAKRYYAGPRSYLPLSLYHPFNVLRRDSYETLRTLRDRFGVTCGLSVFIGTQRLVVELAVASDTLSPYYQTHLTSPLHAAASGKLLLLNFPAEQRRDLLGPAPYPQYTPHTITDADAVERDLALTAERGYAVSLNENFKGISAVGAPINVTSQRAVGAITFAGPSAHFTSGTVLEMGTAARQAADLLALGSPGVRAVRQQLGF
ncbi:MAG TPA: IclR family transcriptional regulator [Steroidobacteraceae bacterium]|jgi:DNA-binding IclR family transcriptional regulator|nr:IclR family transcriptional regulator [Steroidobacteraceae bacterium]